MTDHLKTIVGIVAVAAAPVLTAIIFFAPLEKGAYEAAIVLATLAWQHAGTVIRSLFPGPEIDVTPPQKDTER
jgi:hypothetical protein